MADCDPVLLAGDGCINCLTDGQKLTAEIGLLCRILQALDPMADCDPVALAGDGCANCLMPGQKMTAIWALSCEILDNLSGLACVRSGAGSPEGVEVADVPCIYIQTDVPGVVWFKVTGDGTANGWAPNS